MADRSTRVYIVQHLVQHNMKDYPAGSEFPESDATPEQIAALSARGALKTVEEQAEADANAARQAELEAEIRLVEAEQEELKAKQAEATREALWDAPPERWPKVF